MCYPYKAIDKLNLIFNIPSVAYLLLLLLVEREKLRWKLEQYNALLISTEYS